MEDGNENDPIASPGAACLPCLLPRGISVTAVLIGARLAAVGKDKYCGCLYLLAIYLGGQIPDPVTRCSPKSPRSRGGLHSGQGISPRQGYAPGRQPSRRNQPEGQVRRVGRNSERLIRDVLFPQDRSPISHRRCKKRRAGSVVADIGED